MHRRSPLETPLALLGLALAVIHGIGEAVWEWYFDQFVLALLVDYIAVALLAYAGWMSLRVRPASAAGLLAGAWGFMACLAYRVFSWRLEEFLAEGGSARGEPPLLLVALGIETGVSLLALVVAMALAHPRPGSRRVRSGQKTL